MGECLDAGEPGSDPRVVVDRDAALGRMRHIRIAGEIRDRRARRREKRPIGQVLVHEREHPVRNFTCPHRIAGHLPLERHAGRRRAIHDLSGGYGEPALHVRGGHRLDRKPSAAAVIALGQIDEDRVAVGEHQIAVLEHRNLLQGVEGPKGRRVTDRCRRIDELKVESQHPQQEFDPVRVPREGSSMQADR